MARFYTSASNSRGNTTTAQGESKGQTVHTRGWSGGIRVESRPDGDCDTFAVYSTGGSHKPGNVQLLGRLIVHKDGTLQWNAATLPDPISEEEGSLELAAAFTDADLAEMFGN